MIEENIKSHNFTGGVVPDLNIKFMYSRGSDNIQINVTTKKLGTDIDMLYGMPFDVKQFLDIADKIKEEYNKRISE